MKKLLLVLSFLMAMPAWAGVGIDSWELPSEVAWSGSALNVTGNLTASGSIVSGGTMVADGLGIFNAAIVVDGGESTFSDTVTFSDSATFNSFVIHGSSAITVADNGNGGTPATHTLTPNRSLVIYTCNDAQTCDITLSESGATTGSVVTIFNAGTNVVDFADTAGLTEIAGAFAAGQWDNIMLMYVTSTWVEIGRKDN